MSEWPEDDIELLAPEVDIDAAFERFAISRSSRQRRRWMGIGVTVLLCGIAGALLVLRGGGSEVVVVGTAAAPAGSESTGPLGEGLVEPVDFLTLNWIDARGGPAGTERVVLVFDGDLPDVPVHFVDDVASPEPLSVSYTTQRNAGAVSVCGSVHSFPNAAIGSVDVLLPGSWFEPGSEDYRGTLRVDPVANGIAKIITCEPDSGFIQISVWGPAADNPADIAVSIQGNELTIEIEPETDPSPAADQTTGPAVAAETFGGTRACPLGASKQISLAEIVGEREEIRDGELGEVLTFVQAHIRTTYPDDAPIRTSPLAIAGSGASDLGPRHVVPVVAPWDGSESPTFGASFSVVKTTFGFGIAESWGCTPFVQGDPVLSSGASAPEYSSGFLAEVAAVPKQTISSCPTRFSGPAQDFEIVLQSVALPTSPGFPHALQTSARQARDGSVFYFAKTGLVWNSAAAFELVVPAELQSDMVIGWGAPAVPAHEISVACEGSDGWSGLPGGYWVTEPICAELIVRTADNEERVAIGLGKACDGQQAPPEPSDG